MKRRLFLTGAPGTGKSVMLARSLDASARFAGGYIVLPGGVMLPAAELAVPNIRRRGREMFTVAAAAAQLAGARAKPFAVFDELGGAALGDVEYYDELVRLLFAGVPMLGVLRREGAPESEWGELYSLLDHDPDTLILPTTGKYDINAAGALRHWSLEWAHA